MHAAVFSGTAILLSSGINSLMEKIWLRHYPPGMPKTLELDPEESLVDLFNASCEEFAELPAFTNFGHTITYAELDDLAARFAAHLQTATSLQRGERVALMLPNLLQFPVAMFGIFRAGFVTVNINPLYTPPELEHQLIDSGAKVIVISANSAATLAKVIGNTDIEHVIVTEIGDLLGFPRRWIVNLIVRYIKRMVSPYQLDGAISFHQAIAADKERFQPVSVSGRDLACLQYTGGTTGRAKGAMLSHGNLIANIYQVNSVFSSRVEKGVEIMITALPLYHIYALMCNCLCYLAIGARNVLITDPRDTAGFVNELKKWKFTAITGVNTLYQSLVNHPRLPEVDFSHLNIASAGGMAVMEDTARQWFKITGTDIIEGYGLSETSPVLTSNPADTQGFNGSIGMPLPNTDISLRNQKGKEVPQGEPGELCARGPQVMSGYWNAPEATSRVMTKDGFFRTGDIAIMDESGYFRIVDRIKDMIIVGGFNVYPNEIEDVVTLHPDVIEAACVGVRTDQKREIVKVFVVLKPGATTTAEGIREHCQKNLAAYKVPKLVEFRDELPKSNVGKILRRALRDEAPDSA
jgi:long-chain acyl-CoA synthetase